MNIKCVYSSYPLGTYAIKINENENLITRFYKFPIGHKESLFSLSFVIIPHKNNKNVIIRRKNPLKYVK